MHRSKIPGLGIGSRFIHLLSSAGSILGRNDEVVDLSLISSPTFFDEQLKGMTGQYFYFPVRVVPFNQQANSFEAVGLLGKEVLRAHFERCP